jgi:DNA repair exonuclease SbcCD ATPase subunit
MIHLNLKKFKQFSDLSIELPETGLVMLSGPSGAGKTSVFEAMREALWGDGDDVQPWGSTKSCVELKAWGLNITRSRGSRSLLVNGKPDAQGEELIENALRMDVHEFMASSYIQQKQKNSLLSLTPAEQLRFVQRLVAGSVDPELFRSKLAVIKQQVDAALDAMKWQQAKMESEKESLQNQVGVLLIQLNATVTPNGMTDEQIINNYNMLNKANEEILACSKTIAQLSAAIQQNHFNKTQKNNLNNRRVELLDSIAKKQQTLQTLQQKINKRDDLEQKLIENTHQKEQYQKVIEFWHWNEKKDSFVTSLGLELGGSTVGDALQRSIQELENRHGAYQQSARDLSRTVDLMQLNKGSHSCPECGTALGIDKGNIVKKTAFDHAMFQAKTDELSALTTKITKTGDEIRVRQSHLIQYNDLIGIYKNLLVKKATIPKEEAQKQIQFLSQENEKITNILEDVRANSKAISLLDDDLTVFAKKVAEIDSEISAIGQIDESSMLAEKEAMDNKLKDWHSIKLTVFNAAEDFQNWSQTKAKKESIEMTVKSLNHTIQQKERDIQALSIDIKKQAAKAGACRRLLDLSKQASMMAINHLLEEINFYATTTLSGFFPSEGTSIRLRNSYETQKGEQKPKISLEIFHKGQTPKKLSSLSGGEESRVTLAFQMALSELYNSPILLVDEGFVGLPLEQKLECLEMLKPISQKKLVCVIEHGMPEHVFDQIIYI